MGCVTGGVCWLKIINHWDKRDNSALCAEKKAKSGLELLTVETEVATHTFQAYLRKKR